MHYLWQLGNINLIHQLEVKVAAHDLIVHVFLVRVMAFIEHNQRKALQVFNLATLQGIDQQLCCHNKNVAPEMQLTNL